MADVVLGVRLVVAAVLADVVAALVALATPVEDEAEHLKAPNAAVLVELGLLGQHLGFALLLLQRALDGPGQQRHGQNSVEGEQATSTTPWRFTTEYCYGR